MQKLARTSLVYLIVGLVFGVYYREFTKFTGFNGKTQLAVLHTHTLVLGMLFFLLVLLLEKNFSLSQQKHFNKFFLFFNLGLIITLAMLLVHGTLTVLGHPDSAAISGIAGMGHILLTIGLGFFFHCLLKSLPSA
ncbi:DUF2871 domain-containing protein [Enterococcus sp. AZ109]|uniref:DUF2871 domain-containing protein n=1 Tax=Enterococcus sp. AZ109 TaxID=2774634 RepID=UPI003F2780A0